ncbi:MAG: hypothetical protein AMJ61_06550 [Desulfobacterales bacterium SG8_35_2]|nr:MAG: hypothetical protein AMJ61_06550 [Desulfobacterales bacterium SG8_35_2]
MKKIIFAPLAVGLFFGAFAQQALAGPAIRMPDNVGWLQINYEMQLYGQWRDNGSGADGTDSTTDLYFRRNRLSLRGMMNEKYGFYYAQEFQGDRYIGALNTWTTPVDDFFVLDAFFIANYSDAFNLRAGLTKDPLVREHNVGCFFPLSLDRSLFVYTSIPRVSRDFGVVLWGNFMNQKMQYKVSAMEGIDSVNQASSSLRYTGRIHYSFLEPENLPLYFSTYLGDKKVLTVGAGYQFEMDAAYGNQALYTAEKDYRAWTFDLFAEYPTASGTFTFGAAYLDSDFDDAYLGGDPSPQSTGIDGQKNGYYFKAGYLLPNKVGPGQLQFFGRYENWSFARLGSVDDQEIDWYSLGANYYLNGQDMRLTFEYAVNDFDRENPADPATADFDTATLMFQFRF